MSIWGLLDFSVRLNLNSIDLSEEIVKIESTLKSPTHLLFDPLDVFENPI
jgi:hypothetical protein